MTIKRKILAGAVGSAVMVSLVTIVGAMTTLRLQKTLAMVEHTEFPELEEAADLLHDTVSLRRALGEYVDAVGDGHPAKIQRYSLKIGAALDQTAAMVSRFKARAHAQIAGLGNDLEGVEYADADARRIMPVEEAMGLARTAWAEFCSHVDQAGDGTSDAALYKAVQNAFDSLISVSMSIHSGTKADVGQLMQKAGRRATSSVQILVISAVLAVALSLALGWLVAVSLSSRLSLLTDGARKIGAGDLETRIEVRTHDEMGELAEAFNEMAAGLIQSRDELRENQMRFQELAETIRQVFWVTSPDTSVVHYVSPAYEEVWGRSRASIYENAMSFVEAVHPDDRPKLIVALEAKKTGNFEREYRVIRPDGTVRWIYDRGFPVRDETGQVIRVVGLAEDITSRKLAEMVLRQNEATLARAQQVANVGSWDWDIASDTLLWSDQYYRIFDVDPREFAPTYEAVLEKIHPEDRVHVRTAIESALAGTAQYCVEYRVTVRDGSTRVVLAQGDVDRDDAGKPIRMVGTALDVTERKKAENSIRTAHDGLEQRVQERTAELKDAVDALRKSEVELQRAKASAEAASLAKSAFLANMSHEIRTPMAAIIGHADLMLDRDRSPADRLDSISAIRRSGDHLLGLINDILDLSKIEAGKMTVERVECDPCRIIGEVASLMRPRAQEKGLSFDLAFETPLPRTIESDPTRLRQILINLVGNAIKFTNAGSVRVVVRLDEAPGLDPLLWFEVTDTGVGMTQEQVARIFQPFAQADGSTTRQFGGTGLGLTICRRLARLMGGEVDVGTEPGRGSRFTLWLPTGPLRDRPIITNPAEAARPGDDVRPKDAPPTAASLAGARVLLAEDGPENQVIIAAFLRKAGAEVTIADDGREAVELARSRPFDVILMDMQMPHLDGYGAASTLRQDGMTLPIIALTAHAMAEDRGKCITAGCTDYLTKPVSRADLLAAVHRHLSAAAGPPEREPTAAAPPALIPGATLRSELAGDRDVRAFLPAYLELLPQRVAAAVSLAAQSDLAALRDVVHQLKGSGGMYGFPQITHCAAEAERRIKELEPLKAIREGVDSLVRLVRSIEGYDPTLEPARAKATDPDPAGA